MADIFGGVYNAPRSKVLYKSSHRVVLTLEIFLNGVPLPVRHPLSSCSLPFNCALMLYSKLVECYVRSNDANKNKYDSNSNYNNNKNKNNKLK